MADYTLTITNTAADGKMHGSYQITAGSKAKSQDCHFGPGPVEQSAYLLLITGLGDLITRIQRNDKQPGDYSIAIIGDMPEPPDGRVLKSKQRAMGLLRAFREWEIVDTEAEKVIL